MATPVQQIIFDSVVIAFFVLGIGAAAVGAGLIVCSAKVFRLFAVANRYVSTRRATKSIAVPRDIQPALLRHRKWLAAAIIAGAAYSLFSLLTNFNAAAIASAVVSGDGGAPYLVAQWLVEALGWAMVAFSLIGLAAGIMLAFFPGALSTVEQYANRWYSVRKATAGMNKNHLALDRWVEAFPRTAGLAIVLGALIVTVSSGLLFFK